MVRVRVETPFAAIAVGLKAFAIEGGVTTAIEAAAVPPVMGTSSPEPSSNWALTAPLVLFLVPALVPVTFTETVHQPTGGIVTKLIAMLLAPGLAVTVGLTHVPARPLGLATTRPAGRLSFSAVLTSVVLEFGFVKLKVSEVVPFRGTLAAPKALLTVGGWTTSTNTVLLKLPAPLSLALTGPVVFARVPVPVTSRFTPTPHDPAALDNGPNRGL